MDRACRRSDGEKGLMCWNIICSICFVKCSSCEASYSMIHVFVPLTVRSMPSSYLTRLEENWQPRQIFHHMIALYDAWGSMFQRMKPSRKSTIVVPKPFHFLAGLDSESWRRRHSSCRHEFCSKLLSSSPRDLFPLRQGFGTVVPLDLTLVDGQGIRINLGVARSNCLVAPRARYDRWGLPSSHTSSLPVGSRVVHPGR